MIDQHLPEKILISLDLFLDNISNLYQNPENQIQIAGSHLEERRRTSLMTWTLYYSENRLDQGLTLQGGPNSLGGLGSFVDHKSEG